MIILTVRLNWCNNGQPRRETFDVEVNYPENAERRVENEARRLFFEIFAADNATISLDAFPKRHRP